MPTTDPFKSFTSGLESPATKAQEVTPQEGFFQFFRGLYVGEGGDVTVVMVNDSAPVTFSGVPSGTFMPIRVKEIHDTTTTAANIIGLT